MIVSLPPALRSAVFSRFPTSFSRCTSRTRFRMASSTPTSSALVDPTWLSTHLSDVTVLDASWHMPAAKRDAHAEFLAAHIPG